MDNILEEIKKIQNTDKAAEAKARERLLILAKPPGSLGRLEDIAVQMAGITGKVHNAVDKRLVLIMCADNGVVAEGVASAPQAVTLAQSINFTKGLTGVAVLAKAFSSDLKVIDVGINAQGDFPGIVNKKIAMGTNNMAKGPGMTKEEALQAIAVGIETAKDAAAAGYEILGAGEMGIGNTTTSSAVLSALTGVSVAACAGKGAGLDNEGYERKKAVIQKALDTLKPDKNDPVDILAKVGGFDIAAMAGVYLGGALCRLPVVIDGYISAVAALAAARLNPVAKEYMIPSHASAEMGYGHTMKALGLEPALHLNMRLGEGSGCPLMFMVVSGACAVINNMGTFSESNIDEDYLDAVKDGDSFQV